MCCEREPSNRDPWTTFSFREELNKLVSGGLPGVLAVLLQRRAHHSGGLIVTGHLMERRRAGPLPQHTWHVPQDAVLEGREGGVLIMQAICLQPGFRIWMTISPPYYTAWLNTCFWLVKQGVGLLFLYSRLMLRTTDRYYGRYSNSNRHNQFKSILNK